MSDAQQNIRIMLVDDHKTMLWGLARLIQGQSPQMTVVGCACTCEEAVSGAGTLRPDVILLDFDLNGCCSLDILPAMLASGTARALAFTATRDNALLDRAVHSGVRGVVRKTAEPATVLQAITKVHQGELWLDNETLARVFSEMMTPASPRKHDPELTKQASLTTRERHVIDAVVAGCGAANKTLAQRLFISEHTLRNHLTAIYEKLGVTNRLELYIYATKHKLSRP